MCKNYLFTLIAVLLSATLALAQQRTVTGTILDSKTNEPLPGASVIIPGTKTGTVADVAGKFSIAVPQSATGITVSFIGYATQTVSVVNTNTVTVSLAEGGQLAEVVVLGYTTARKQDLTGLT